MISINQVMIAGRLGKDPESRTTGGGLTIGNLSVATEERRKDGNDWKSETEWHRVVVFGKTAEACCTHLRKGDVVSITGRLKTSSWEKEGVKRYKTEIIAERVVFPGTRRSGEGAGRDDDYSGGASPAPSGPEPRGQADDELPF